MFRRALAAGLALALMVCAGPASALPRPRGDQWWFATMGVQGAWERSTGRGVTVAVIDRTFNRGLPEFAGADVREGRDFRRKGDPAAKSWEEKNHGTGMLGLIAAGGGGSGYLGVAPDAAVLTVPMSVSSNMGELIRYAVDQGADVVSMSFSRLNPVIDELHCDADLEDAIIYAAEHDVVLVASAGNNESGENLTFEPAMCPGVVAVGGLSRRSAPKEGALHHDYIAVAAPSGSMPVLSASGGLSRVDGGTSSAAALTAGAIALIRAAHPGESARQAVARLLYTARDVHTPGRDDYTGYGLIRPDLALAAEVPAGFSNAVYERFDTFAKEQANWKDAVENPPDFTVGGDPDRKRRTTNDWQTYGPWLLGAGVLALAAVLAVAVLFRRSRARAKRQGGAV